MAKVLHLLDYQKNVLIKVLPAPAQAQCLNGGELRAYRDILTMLTGKDYSFPDTDEGLSEVRG